MTALATPPADVDRFAHQEQGIQFALDRPGAIWDAGMSAGKTKMYIEVAERTDAQIVIVICPDKVRGVFPREVAKHGARNWLTWNGTVQGARGPLASPSVARRAEAVVQAHRDALILRRPLMVIVNYQACWRGDMAAILHGLPATLLILDEIHKIKAPGGKTSRFCTALGQRVRARGGKVLGGTGTLCPHDELDAYAQLRATDPSILGTSFSRVKARYGKPRVKYTHADGTPEYLTTGAGQLIYEGVREDRRDEYAQLLARGIYRIDQETIDRNLGLEAPVEEYLEIDLDPATRRAYEQLERDLIADVQGGIITAANAMVAVLRLAQVASGFGVDADDPGRIIPLSDPPELARLLADKLDDIPRHKPVVVFARFRHDLDQIARVAERTGRRYGELSGRRRDGLTTDSTMADVDLLGCQAQSGGVGVDLTRSHHGIYYSPDYDGGNHKQSQRRLLREGQRHVVELSYLISAPIHRRIYRALNHRESVTTAFLDYMKEVTP